jgi:putative tributyrin esterase
MIKRSHRFKLSALLIALSAFVSAFTIEAQVKPSVTTSAPDTTSFVREYKLKSKLMARELPYDLIAPADYDANAAKAKRYPVIYLLHGLTGHYDNWAAKSKLAEYALKYQYIFVMPEGNDGWYTDSVSVPTDKYESYIVQELIPEIDGKFRTLADREHRAIAGLSMGGYGSLKFGLKYPEKFVVVGSFSGALGAASWSVKTLGNNWKALTDSIASVYGDDESQTRKDNDIYKIVREISPEKVKALPFIYVDCGTEDFLIQQNRDFNALLAEKKIPHEYRELPGKHDWAFWDSQVQEFLRVSQKFIK